MTEHKPIHLIAQPWSVKTLCGIRHPDRDNRDCPYTLVETVPHIDLESWAAKGRPFILCETCAAEAGVDPGREPSLFDHLTW